MRIVCVGLYGIRLGNIQVQNGLQFELVLHHPSYLKHKYSTFILWGLTLQLTDRLGHLRDEGLPIVHNTVTYGLLGLHLEQLDWFGVSVELQ